jgi:predicted phage tail protein
MQTRKIIIYGTLRKFLGKVYFEAVVSSPRQAFQFLIANFPEVENHINDQFYKVKMNNLDVDFEYLDLQGEGDIKIIPAVFGSIPAVGTFFGGLFSGGIVAAAKTVAVAALKSVATNFVISGVTSLIAPTPSVPDSSIEDLTSQNDPEAQSAFGFSGITNVSRSGVAVPIIYGEVFTGSIVISSGIDTVQVEG